MDRPGHRGTDRLKERGGEKGSSRRSTGQHWHRFGDSQALTAGDGAECVWAFLSAAMLSWGELHIQRKRKEKPTSLFLFLPFPRRRSTDLARPNKKLMENRCIAAALFE